MLDLDYASLTSGLVIGMIGTGVFMYGKNTRDLRYLAAGAGLAVFPYFVGSVMGMWGITAGVLALLWLGKRSAV